MLLHVCMYNAQSEGEQGAPPLNSLQLIFCAVSDTCHIVVEISFVLLFAAAWSQILFSDGRKQQYDSAPGSCPLLFVRELILCRPARRLLAIFSWPCGKLDSASWVNVSRLAYWFCIEWSLQASCTSYSVDDDECIWEKKETLGCPNACKHNIR